MVNYLKVLSILLVTGAFLTPAFALADYQYQDASGIVTLTGSTIVLNQASSYSVGLTITGLPNILNSGNTIDDTNFPTGWVETANYCDRAQGYTGAAGSTQTFSFGGYPSADGLYGILFSFGTSQDGYGTPLNCSSGYAVIVRKTGSTYTLVSGGGTDTTTHIASTTPLNNDTVATSTTFSFGVSGYVNPADFIAGQTSVSVSYSNGGFESSQLVGPALALQQQTDSSGNFTFIIPAAGAFSFSTTTNLQQIGNYSMVSSISRPKYSLLGFNFLTTTLAATTTSFEVATTTAFGSLRQSVQHDYQTMINNANSAMDTSVCSPLSGNFSIVPCLTVMFTFPTTQQLTADFNNLHDNVLTHQPWAYPTRFFSILFGSTTPQDLPSFTVDIALGADSSTTLTYSPSDMLAGGAVLLNNIHDPHSDKSLEDIIKPFIQLFVAISVLIIIIHDLWGMGHASKGGKNYA